MAPTAKWDKDTSPRNQDRYERVHWLQDQYHRYETYWKPEVDRYYENARMYWHVNFGQWPMEVVDRLRAQGRRPPTIPIIPDKIETLVGVFLSNDFDIQYTPHNGRVTTMTLAAQEMYYDDKDNMSWDIPETMTILDSHIMVGYERMMIADAVDGFGSIAWENVNGRHVYLRPGWKDDDVDNIDDYFMWDDKSTSQIISAYPNASDKIKEAAEREKRDGVDYGEFEGAVPRYRSFEEKWNAFHRVMEYHYVEKIERWWEYDMKNHCFFPDTNEKMGSDEDRKIKARYIQAMGISGNDVTYLKQKKKVKRIEVVCPSLDREMFLTAGKDIIQTNNANIYPMGIRYQGQYQGVVDRLRDIQVGANKGEMNIQDIQARSAKGAFILDRALSGGDPELEERIEQSWNDPGARIWVDEGSTERLGPTGGVIPLQSVAPTSDQFHQTERYYELGDRFSKVPAAQDSRSESGKESGRLFRYKLEVAMVGQKYLLKRYEWHKVKKGKAYLRQAKVTYAGYPRTFGKRNGKETFTINKQVRDEYTGRTLYVDDIRALPEMKVKAVPVRSSINVRMQTREQLEPYLEILQAPEDRLLRTCIIQTMIETNDLPDEKKQEFDKACWLTKMDAAALMAVNVQGNMAKLQQQMGAVQEMFGNNMMSPQQGQNIEQSITSEPPSQEEILAGTPMQPMEQEEPVEDTTAEVLS